MYYEQLHLLHANTAFDALHTAPNTISWWIINVVNCNLIVFYCILLNTCLVGANKWFSLWPRNELSLICSNNVAIKVINLTDGNGVDYVGINGRSHQQNRCCVYHSFCAKETLPSTRRPLRRHPNQLVRQLLWHFWGSNLHANRRHQISLTCNGRKRMLPVSNSMHAPEYTISICKKWWDRSESDQWIGRRSLHINWENVSLFSHFNRYFFSVLSLVARPTWNRAIPTIVRLLICRVQIQSHKLHQLCKEYWKK